MKRLLAVGAGLISSLITSILIILVAVYMGFEVQSFGLFFIVPIGSLFIGFAGAIGYGLTIKMTQQKAAGIDYLLTALIGILCAFILYFLFYKVSYVNSRGEILYSLSAGRYTPIEEYKAENGKALSFFPYTIKSINERQLAFSYNGRGLFTTPSNPLIGWIDFIIEMIGYTVGALAAFGVFVNTKYCDNCKVYYKKKKWLEANIEDQAVVEKIDACIKNHSNLQEILQSIPASSGKINMLFEGESCSKCGDGIFRINFQVLQKDGDRKEIEDLKQEVAIKNNSALKTDFSLAKIIEKIKSQSAV